MSVRVVSPILRPASSRWEIKPWRSIGSRTGGQWMPAAGSPPSSTLDTWHSPSSRWFIRYFFIQCKEFLYTLARAGAKRANKDRDTYYNLAAHTKWQTYNICRLDLVMPVRTPAWPRTAAAGLRPLPGWPLWRPLRRTQRCSKRAGLLFNRYRILNKSSFSS